jgi:hypothetical protein
MNIYPLPMNDMMKTNIEKVVQDTKGKCKTCGGSGISTSFTNEYNLKTDKPCQDCTPLMKQKALHIMSGLPYGFLNIDKIHKNINKDDKKFLQLTVEEFQEAPLDFLMVSLFSEFKGVGKTGSSAYLLKEFMKILTNVDPELETSPITWISTNTYVDMIFQGLNISRKSDEQQLYYEQFMQSVFKNQILFIDGLGDHFLKKNDNSDENFIAGKIESLIRYRQDNNLPIIATSNYPLYYKTTEGKSRTDFDGEKPTLLQKYGERVIGLWLRGDSFWYNWKTEMPIRGLCHTKNKLTNFLKKENNE